MEEIARQIWEQAEINFKNIEDQIKTADLESVFDGVNGSRWIFHYLHSADRFFINPAEYVYKGEELFGIPENLSVIDEARDGYVADTSIVIGREQLEKYFAFVKEKIKNYFESLTAAELLEKPNACEYTRLELILAQFRHQMWHVGVSSAITFSATGKWNEFTGLSGLRKMIKHCHSELVSESTCH